MSNKLTSKCNDCPSRKPYWEYIDGTKKYQCVEIVCKRKGENHGQTRSNRKIKTK